MDVITRIALAGALSALAGVTVGCGGHSRSEPEMPVVRMQGGRCPVTKPMAAGQAPSALSRLVGSDAAASFGKGDLWVLLPSAGGPNAVRQDGAYGVKVAWFLDGAGDLRVLGKRIDGDGRLSYGSAYKVPGVDARLQPSTLTVSAPGCYAVRAEHGDASITWVFRALP
jgi:hypothetical protein